MPRGKFRGVSLQKELIEAVENYLKNNPDAPYRSVAEFISEAVRLRLEQLKAWPPPISIMHLNIDGSIVLLWDNIKQHSIHVEFKEDKIFCHFCQSKKCYHVRFTLNIPEVKKEFKRRKRLGLKYPQVDLDELEPYPKEYWWGCPDLNRGPESPSLLVDWRMLRKDFLVWLNSRGLAFDYKRSIVNYLDRFAPKLSRPLDVVKLFDGLSAGQKHCLLFSLRNLFNFCELAGFDPAFIDGLRKALPKDSRFVDSYVPSEEVIRRSLGKLRRIPEKYKAVYRLLLESGLRLIEAVKLSLIHI